MSDVIEPLQSYPLSSSSDQNIFTCATSNASCVELLNDFNDKALQPRYDPWVSVDFCDRSKIHAVLTKAYKNVRVAAIVDTDTEGTGSPESSKKLLPQRKLPAQMPRIYLGKTSRAVAAKTFAVKLRPSRPGASSDST